MRDTVDHAATGGHRHCLDDSEILALIELRLAGAARELAFGHLDACRACLELVAALLRCLERSP